MKLIDMTGKKVGRLTVIGQSEKRTKMGHVYWVCRCDCGAEKSIIGGNLRKKHTLSCGCYQRERAKEEGLKRIGAKSPRWKGGRSKDRHGYIWIQDTTHPNSNKGGRVAEHVVVMGESLGRPLLNNEEVHHINGIKDDNRISNLELWTRSHPAGIRACDAVAWAKEIIETYNGIQFEPIDE